MNNPNKMIAHCQNTKPGFSDSISFISSFEGEKMPRRYSKAKIRIIPPNRSSMAKRKDFAL
tara:strand:+ start:187 stop:369 length:183 start_codon:yes stop_codon:yes gene_type:complete